TLREGNICSDFLVKNGASSDFDLTIHTSPPKGFFDILRSDVEEFFRE
ncbi:hypothetical protein A2U01_0080937, partial [Trifolium medium]|nr:hypothetical protein [Trifolium medium]